MTPQYPLLNGEYKHVQENYIVERGNHQGRIKRISTQQRGGNAKQFVRLEGKRSDQAAKYEHTESRQGYRSGHYDRNLITTSGNVTLKVSKLKGIPFEIAIIEWYRRRESSVEEDFIEMHLAGVSVR